MTRRRARGARAGPPVPLPVPHGLRCDHRDLDGAEYHVLDFPAAAADDVTAPGPWSLTLAEREVAAAAVAGKSNQEIAAARGVSTRTVANQLAAVYRKLGINSRAELAAFWHGTRGPGR
ncbi:MAG: helix-turn-helix transcriptional regulator [Deltaproteobacteria bacterium]|nr:helix-turn-helix transcriptional regulator [Deltaproteobacteria bacterium]